MRVLVVEDDSALGHFLCRGLGLDGHDVAVVADGETALESVARLGPELMMLDLNVPRKDGLEILAQMGERFRSTSVLVLTARSEMAERVRCLELGADDVVRKPFSFDELRARVKALGRRRRQFGDRVLRFGDLEMDRAERRVTQAGGELDLTATEFSLLESLLQRRGERACSRSELLREVWRMPERIIDGGPATNIVEVYINYLRKKLNRKLGRRLGMQVHCQSVIRNVRGEGYLLDAPVGLEKAPKNTAEWKEANSSQARAGMIAEGWVANG